MSLDFFKDSLGGIYIKVIYSKDFFVIIGQHRNDNERYYICKINQLTLNTSYISDSKF